MELFFWGNNREGINKMDALGTESKNPEKASCAMRLQEGCLHVAGQPLPKPLHLYMHSLLPFRDMLSPSFLKKHFAE
jgi:hypothetical protein